MHVARSSLSVVLAAVLLCSVGCTPETTVTEQERALQDTVDAEVAAALFEAELTPRASYKVHKDGLVVIKFARSVNSDEYTRLVEGLRANERIPAVRAEQAGREVCRLP